MVDFKKALRVLNARKATTKVRTKKPTVKKKVVKKKAKTVKKSLPLKPNLKSQAIIRSETEEGFDDTEYPEFLDELDAGEDATPEPEDEE